MTRLALKGFYYMWLQRDFMPFCSSTWYLAAAQEKNDVYHIVVDNGKVRQNHRNAIADRLNLMQIILKTKRQQIF